MSRLMLQKELSAATIHIMAVDGIINVNSLFTLALFLGLTFSPETGKTSPVPVSCTAGTTVAENLVSFHVYSFSSFLFSSLVASALKQTIKIVDGGKGAESNEGVGEATVVRVNVKLLRFGMLVSGIGSVSGCGFLTMALVNLVQMKLGVLGCKNFHSLAAVCPLLILVPSALIIYVCLVIYAFTR